MIATEPLFWATCTPDYIAPEQARKVHDADIRSDLYSLGCSFYYALTGQRPFRGDTALETVMMHLEKEPTHLSLLRPDVPPPLAAIVHKLMAKDPERRFQTPAELAAELTFLLNSEPALSKSSVKKTQRMAVVRPKTVAPNSEAIVTSILQTPAVNPIAAEADVYLEQIDIRLPPIAPTIEATPENVEEKAELPDAAARFKNAWRQWTSIVETVAAGSTPHLGLQDYRSLHKELLLTCKVLAKTGPQISQSSYARIERLVQPWLSVHNLAATDRSTLLGVRERCLRFSQELGLSHKNRWLWAGAFVAFAAVAMIVGFVFQSGVLEQNAPDSEGLLHLIETHPIICLAVVVPLAVLGSFFIVGRLFRQR